MVPSKAVAACWPLLARVGNIVYGKENDGYGIDCQWHYLILLRIINVQITVWVFNLFVYIQARIQEVFEYTFRESAQQENSSASKQQHIKIMHRSLFYSRAYYVSVLYSTQNENNEIIH